MKKWNKILINTDEGQKEAIEPVVISVSRTTDIPAYKTDWFFDNLNKGYMEWTNSFNRNQKQYISFQGTSAAVFWTKDAEPIIDRLPELDKKNIKNRYFEVV